MKGTQLLSGSARDFSPRHKEEEGERQQEVQEAKGDEEGESEVDGEAGERRMRHGDDDETNKAQT